MVQEFLYGIQKVRQKDQKVCNNAWSATSQKWCWEGISEQENGRKGIDKLWGCIRTEEKNLRWYVRNSVDPLLESVKAAKTIEYNDTVNKKEVKQCWMREKKKLWKNKGMYGQFVREMPERTAEKETWYWLRKADLKVETEAMLCATQEQVTWTSYVKHKIDKTSQCDEKS